MISQFIRKGYTHILYTYLMVLFEIHLIFDGKHIFAFSNSYSVFCFSYFAQNFIGLRKAIIKRYWNLNQDINHWTRYVCCEALLEISLKSRIKIIWFVDNIFILSDLNAIWCLSLEDMIIRYKNSFWKWFSCFSLSFCPSLHRLRDR